MEFRACCKHQHQKDIKGHRQSIRTERKVFGEGGTGGDGLRFSSLSETPKNKQLFRRINSSESES